MKKNSLSSAIVAGVAGIAGLAGVANAVNVNPEGVGQVLLYPYYTVNEGNATLISIVNTTDEVKAVKVRFLESLNSAEVLDFNLYLSPFDVWTGAVGQTASGAGLHTDDTSCTVPLFVGGKDASTGLPVAGAVTEFVPFEFQRSASQGNGGDTAGRTGTVSLGGGPGGEVAISAAERMRQGHIEAIEMGVVVDGAVAGFTPASDATHQADTLIPLDCPELADAFSTGGVWHTPSGGDPNLSIEQPSGGLFGGGLIVDVSFGRALSYNADAIDGFWTAAGLALDTDGTTSDLHSVPGDIQPNLTRARSGTDGTGTEFAQTNVFVNGTVITANFYDPTYKGVQAVSAALMDRYVFNEFNLYDGLAAESEWVVTFPTKRSHLLGNEGGDTRPFTDNVDDDDPADGNPFDIWGACETYTFDRWDREELPAPEVITGPIISPPPPSGPVATNPQLCWESNVIAFDQDLDADTPSAVLGATPKQGAHGLSGVFEGVDAGWARIEFNDPDTVGFDNYLISDDTNPVAFVGLPVIGFWAADYINANAAPGTLAHFSDIHKHRGARGVAVYDAADAGTLPAFGGTLDVSNAASGFGVSN